MTKTLKKILPILLCASLIGCSAANDDVKEETTVENTTTESTETESKTEKSTEKETKATKKTTVAETSTEPETSEEITNEEEYTAENVGYSFYYKTMNKILGKEKTNNVISPVNLYFALGMLAKTTSGNTQKQILDTTNNSDIEEFQKNVDDLYNSGNSDSENYKELYANSL